MAKLVLSIQANDQASESVRTLKAEVQALSKSLSSIKVAASGVETVRKGYANLITTLKSLKSQYADGVFGDMPEQAEKALKVMERLSAALQKNKTLTKDEAKEYAQFSQQLKKLAADLATVKAKNDKIVAANPFTITQAQQIPRLIKQYSTLLNHIKSIEKYYPKGTFDTFKTQLTEGTTQLQGLNQEYQTTQTLTQDSQAQLNGLADGFLQVNAAVAQTTSTMKSSKGSLIDIVTGFAKFQLSAMLVMKPLQWIRSALTSINETLVKTEDAVIALQRVLPSGSASDSEISGKVYDIAQRYGQTFENVSTIAQNFARSGMDWADTIKATEAAVLALNVAELDAEEATNGLIAILSQFNLGASDLETVIDKLNKTADNFPVTTEKILAALQRTGSAATNANLSLDQTVALITALSKATGRSGENIGTALNSLIQYSSKASALDTFAGLSKDTADVVAEFRNGSKNILDVWQQVSKEIKNLKADQADLLDQYFSTEDGEALKEALDGELQDIYTELGGVYDTANTFRKNYFIALLGNMDTVEQAIGTLEGAAGYSQEENKKYLETYTAKVNSLKAQWQDIANDEQGLLGIKKDLVDMGSGVLDIVKGVGGLKAILAIVAMWVTVIVAEVKGAAIVSELQKVLGVITNIATLGLPNLIKQIKLAKQRIAEAGAVAKAATSTALLALTAILTAASALDTWIRNKNEADAEAARKAREEQDAAIAKANESVEAQKQEVQSMEDLAASVENLRNVLDSSTASEDEKRSAQEQLLQIQNTLIDSNNAYKDSLDLTNGSLKEQLGLIEQFTTEQLKQKAQEWLDSTKSERAIANSRLNVTTTTNTDMLLSNVGWLSAGKFRDVLNKVISRAGVGDVVSVNEDNTYTWWDNYGKRVGEGFKNGFWEGLWEFTGIPTSFDPKTYGGESNAGFSFSGTVEEQLAAIKKLRDYIAEHYAELGLTNEQNITFTTELDNQYAALNDDAYKQAQRTHEIEQATEDWFNKTITEAEWLEIVYGIQKKVSQELETADKTLENLTKDNLQALIDALRKMREEQEASLELEEQKQKVIDAQNALLAAQTILQKANAGVLSLGELGEDELQFLLDAINEILDAEEVWESIEEKKSALLEAQNDLAQKQADLTDLQNELWRAQIGLIGDVSELSKNAIKALVSEIDKLRKKDEEAVTLEEKRLAIIKAQKDLEDARNEATIRRYNSETKQYEWQADEKKIASAQEVLDSAIKSFNEYIEKQTWDDIVEELESGNATNESIKDILDSWGLRGLPQEIYDSILSSLTELRLSDSVIDALRQDVATAQEELDEANEKVQSAIESLHKYLEDKAWAEIKDAIASGNVDDAALWEILGKWRALGLPQNSCDRIQDTIQKAIGSDAFKGALQSTVDQLSQSYNDTLSEYEEWLEDKVWKNVIDELESGKATNDSIKELLDKWKGESYQDGLPSWYQGIIGAIKEYGGVDVTVSPSQPAQPSTTPAPSTHDEIENYYKALRDAGMSVDQLSALQRLLSNPGLTDEQRLKTLRDTLLEYVPETSSNSYEASSNFYYAKGTYDSGGAAIGKGLMPKATDRPETVLNPDLTEQILSPVSNAHFDRWVRDMGLLFETSRHYAQTPIIERVAGATDNRVDNSGQTIINGVKVGSDKMQMPFAKVLRLMKIMS